MATKRKGRRKIPNQPYKNNMKGKQDDQNSTAATTPYLPVLVIHRILQFLPTKLAIRMSSLCKQWAGLWSSVPVLDFDNEIEPPHNKIHDILLQHAKFINFLERCLEFHKKYEHLDKFRLRMTKCVPRDESKVAEWLRFAVERRVKELDININDPYTRYYLPMQTLLNAKPITCLKLENLTILDNGKPITLPSLKTLSIRKVTLKHSFLSGLISGCPCIQYLSLTSDYYHPYELFLQTLLDAKSITSLNLEQVRILGENNNNNDPKAPAGHLSLKTMSLKAVDMDSRVFRGLTRSPCLEHLSVTLCSGFDGSRTTISRSSSLKSIQVIITNRNSSKAVQASGVTNLESFTLVSKYSKQFESIQLFGCENLKYLNIHARYLTDFTLHGCSDRLKATLHVPNVNCIRCTDDRVKAKLHVPNLDCVWMYWSSDMGTFSDRLS